MDYCIEGRDPSGAWVVLARNSDLTKMRIMLTVYQQAGMKCRITQGGLPIDDVGNRKEKQIITDYSKRRT